MLANQQKTLGKEKSIEWTQACSTDGAMGCEQLKAYSKEKGKKMRAKMQGWLFVDLHLKIISNNFWCKNGFSLSQKIRTVGIYDLSDVTETEMWKINQRNMLYTYIFCVIPTWN